MVFSPLDAPLRRPIGKLNTILPDILEASYHDLRSELILKTKHSFTAIKSAVRTRDIKKLMLDSSLPVTMMKEI